MRLLGVDEKRASWWKESNPRAASFPDPTEALQLFEGTLAGQYISGQPLCNSYSLSRSEPSAPPRRLLSFPRVGACFLLPAVLLDAMLATSLALLIIWAKLVGGHMSIWDP